MQTKTGALLSMGRIPQFIGTSAFALSALAGGVMLSSGEANAGPLTCNPSSVTITDPGAGFSGSVTDTVTNASSGLASGSSCTTGPTSILYPNNQTFVRVDYNPGLTASDTFSYTFSKNRSDVWFDQVSLSLTDANPNPLETVTKNVYADSTKATLLATLTTNGPTVSAPLPNQYSSVYVEDISNGNGGSITAVTNGFRQTPGPLPILGAGAAFGFSRKLRGRIKAARNA